MGDTGRPSKYKDKYDELAYNYCLLGATDSELADFFDVCEATINNWKIDYPSFLESLKKGKQIADAKVAKAIFHRATGYEHEDVDIKMYEGSIIKTKYTKRYAPDPTSAIFWLKNRQPGKWRDKVGHDVTTNGESVNKPLVIELVAPNVNSKD